MQTAVSATLCETDCGFPNGSELRAVQVNTAKRSWPPPLRLSTLGKTTRSPLCPCAALSRTAALSAPEKKERRKGEGKGQYLSGLSCIIVLKIKIVHDVNNLYFKTRELHESLGDESESSVKSLRGESEQESPCIKTGDITVMSATQRRDLHIWA